MGKKGTKDEEDATEEGATHSIECTIARCLLWVDIWLPKRIAKAQLKSILERDFLCGFCAADRVNKLKEELEEMRRTMEDVCGKQNELRTSYAEAVKEAHETKKSFAEVLSGENLTKLARTIKREQEEHQNRERNVIISGARVGTKEEDLALVKEIADDIGVNLDGVKLELERIGKVQENGNQLLRVRMSADKKRELLSGARNLARGNFKDVFIRPDRTPAEQKADFELRKELKAKKSEHPGTPWVIQRGKVVERKTSGNAEAK